MGVRGIGGVGTGAPVLTQRVEGDIITKRETSAATLMGSAAFSATISVRSYYSSRYLWSAQHHARLAQEIEDHHSNGSTFDIAHSVYVMDAITDAVAFVEAAVNEVAQDVSDLRESYVAVLDESVRQHIAGYWVAGSEASTLAKYSAILRFATGQELDRGCEPNQSMAILIRLRNYLVHYKPSDVSEAFDPPALARQLAGRFPDNVLMTGMGNAWFPDVALGAGCAQWAARTAKDFVDAWSQALGITLNVHQVVLGGAP